MEYVVTTQIRKLRAVPAVMQLKSGNSRIVHLIRMRCPAGISASYKQQWINEQLPRQPRHNAPLLLLHQWLIFGVHNINGTCPSLVWCFVFSARCNNAHWAQKIQRTLHWGGPEKCTHWPRHSGVFGYLGVLGQMETENGLWFCKTQPRQQATCRQTDNLWFIKGS